MRTRFLSSRYVQKAFTALLISVALYQTYSVLSDYGRTWASRAWRTAHMSAMERNSLFLLGGRGSDFVDFLASKIPPSGTVVVPPKVVEFSEQNLLQFFLMPRGILSCFCDYDSTNYSEYCVECLLEESHYVPAIGEFPSSEVMSGSKRFIPHDKDTGWFHGLYAPIDQSNISHVLPEQEDLPRFAAVAIDIAIYLSLLILGAVIASLVTRSLTWSRALIVGIPLGVGSLTWSVFIGSWLGLPVTLATFLLAYILLLSTAVALRRLTGGRGQPAILPSLNTDLARQLRSKSASVLLIWSLLISLFLLAMAISIVRGYSLYDGIANWALKGYGIALEHSVYAGLKWGGHSLSYPQNLHLLIALFKLADGDVLPGSKLLFPLFTGSMLLACYKAWRRNQLDELDAALGILVIFSVPTIFVHSTIGWANLAFTTYLVLGATYWIEGLVDDSSDSLLLGALLLAFATWTRPEGLIFAIAISVSTVAWMRISGGRASLSLPQLLPLALIPASYLIFSYSSMRGGEIGQAIEGFLRRLAEGNVDLRPGLFLLQYSLDHFLLTDTWGFTFFGVTVMLLLVIAAGKRLGRLHSLLIQTAVITLLVPLSMFYIASFSKSNFDLFLSVSFDRAMLPASILILVFAIAIGGRQPNPLGLKPPTR